MGLVSLALFLSPATALPLQTADTSADTGLPTLPDDTGATGATLSRAYRYDCTKPGPLSGFDGWTSGYPVDPWEAAADRCTPTLDDQGASWGTGSPLDNHLVQTGPELAWTDHVVEAVLTSNDDDAVGLVFRFQDARNFYLAFFTRQNGPTEGKGSTADLGASGHLYVVEDGIATALASSSSTFEQGEEHTLRVEAIGAQLRVALDGVVQLESRHAGLSSGRIGLYSMDNAQASFDYVEVFAVGSSTPPDPADPPEPPSGGSGEVPPGALPRSSEVGPRGAGCGCGGGAPHGPLGLALVGLWLRRRRTGARA